MGREGLKPPTAVIFMKLLINSYKFEKEEGGEGLEEEEGEATPPAVISDFATGGMQQQFQTGTDFLHLECQPRSIRSG